MILQQQKMNKTSKLLISVSY